MSMAFEDVCKTLDLRDEMSREVTAVRLIELARLGERSPTILRDRTKRASKERHDLRRQFINRRYSASGTP